MLLIRFTFHNVSIKTRAQSRGIQLVILDLHSTMFLLKQNHVGKEIAPEFNLHSTMFLLKQAQQEAGTQNLKRIYIPQCFY